MERYIRPELGVITLEANLDLLKNSNETEHDVFDEVETA